MGCLCPKNIRRKVPDELNEKLNEEPAPTKEEIEANIITVGQSKYQDIEQKRKMAKFLLESDLNIFKRNLPEVLKLSDEEFNELFEGNTEYKFNVIKEKEFRQLAQKFQDNKELTLEYYDKEKYYNYVLQIWRPNILQALKSAEPQQKKDEILSRHKIKVSEWDDDFRDNFMIIISTPPIEDLLASRLKNYIQADYGDFDELIKNVDKCKKKIQNDEESHCNKILRANLETSMNKVVKEIVPNYLKKLKNELPNLYSEIKNKEKENAIQDIIDSGLTKSNEKKLIEKVRKIYEKQQEFDPLNFDFNKEYNQLKELGERFNNEEYFKYAFGGEDIVVFNQTELSEKAEVVFSNEIVKSAVLGLSMANLTYSVSHLSQTLMNYNSFTEQFKSRIDIIRNNFIKHQSEVKVIDDEEDVDKVIELIKENGKKFNQDLTDITELINEIKDAINNVKTEKNKTIFNMFLSGGGLVVGAIGFSCTKGEDRLDYAKASAAQVFSLISNCIDIHTQNKALEEFKGYLEEAYELKDKINNEIDKLRKKFYGLSGKHYS